MLRTSHHAGVSWITSRLAAQPVYVATVRYHRPTRSRCLTPTIKMVEGHQCHRVAHAHRELLVGHKFQCSSPNQRFCEGAAAVNGKFLVKIEVIGKNLFYFFGPEEHAESATDVVHIHFGMSGAFKVLTLPGPEPRETVRLALQNTELGVVCHLSAMTVTHGPAPGLFLEKMAKLGPDPLREDADKEILWEKLQRCKKPIGLVLMSQDLVAGIGIISRAEILFKAGVHPETRLGVSSMQGNIYRAEILFKAGVHPEQPAMTIDRPAFESIWSHSVTLLQRGFVSGSILTVDPEEAKVLGQPWTRRYIYNQSQCGRCKGAVKTWDMAGRTVYCCATCQPLKATASVVVEGLAVATPQPKGRKRAAPATPATPATAAAVAAAAVAALTPARQAAMLASTVARTFRSKCAPDDESSGLGPAKMTVAELKVKLADLGLDTQGSKAKLVARLKEALNDQATATPSKAMASMPSNPKLKANQQQQQELQGAEGAGSGDEVDVAEKLLCSRLTPGPLTAALAPKAEDGETTPAAEFPAVQPPRTCAKAENGEATSEAGHAQEQQQQRSSRKRARTQLGDEAAANAAVNLAVNLAQSRLGSGSAAPSSAAMLGFAAMSVAQLRVELRRRGLPVSGQKAALLQRLLTTAVMAAAAAAGAATPGTPEAAPGTAAAGHATRGTAGSTGRQRGGHPQAAAAPDAPGDAPLHVVPGTANLVMVTAEDAALEKLKAREGRNVEHVALGNDATEAMLAGRAPSRRRRAP